MQKQINKIYGKDAPAWKVGLQPVSCRSMTGRREGMNNAPISLNGYSQRFPSSVMLPCSSIYFFPVAILKIYSRRAEVHAVPSCTTVDFENPFPCSLWLYPTTQDNGRPPPTANTIALNLQSLTQNTKEVSIHTPNTCTDTLY